MSDERTPYLQELIRLSTEATLIIPSIVFNSEHDPLNRFKAFRDALNYLKNDDKLIVTLNKFSNDFAELKIRIGDDEDV